jgi:phosphoribosyl 1,2-cyclic phosphate phosphodiesterase
VRVEILGSGGALTTPKPGCSCRVCVEAREKGIPYSRSGPSVFAHDTMVIDV